MIRLWGKIIKDNRLIDNMEAKNTDDVEYQEQLKRCINEICYKLDIQKPYWLNKNLVEYNRIKRTAFTQDNFIEEISFDRFEIQVLEEK